MLLLRQHLGNTQLTEQARPSRALQIRMRTGPRSQTWPSAGGYRTALLSVIIVCGHAFLSSAYLDTNSSRSRQEAQETPGGLGEASWFVR